MLPSPRMFSIGCFLLEEVLNHNPKVAKDIEELSYCFAIFKNFTGTITFTIKEEKYYSERLPIVYESLQNSLMTSPLSL